ncbi:hypothetical protein HDU76_003926 [Blyttiomyces sp. JEL0837]|nr:hypothetical protein HDU76_003926 [Blyttiomyces sp. JEL0837]
MTSRYSSSSAGNISNSSSDNGRSLSSSSMPSTSTSTPTISSTQQDPSSSSSSSVKRTQSLTLHPTTTTTLNRSNARTRSTKRQMAGPVDVQLEMENRRLQRQLLMERLLVGSVDGGGGQGKENDDDMDIDDEKNNSRTVQGEASVSMVNANDNIKTNASVGIPTSPLRQPSSNPLVPPAMAITGRITSNSSTASSSNIDNQQQAMQHQQQRSGLLSSLFPAKAKFPTPVPPPSYYRRSVDAVELRVPTDDKKEDRTDDFLTARDENAEAKGGEDVQQHGSSMSLLQRVMNGFDLQKFGLNRGHATTTAPSTSESPQPLLVPRTESNTTTVIPLKDESTTAPTLSRPRRLLSNSSNISSNNEATTTNGGVQLTRTPSKSSSILSITSDTKRKSGGFPTPQYPAGSLAASIKAREDMIAETMAYQRRRKIWMYGIGCCGVVLLFLVIFLPVLFLVLIPKWIVEGFAKGDKGAISLEVGRFYGWSDAFGGNSGNGGGVLFDLVMRGSGIDVLMNVPIVIREHSSVRISVWYPGSADQAKWQNVSTPPTSSSIASTLPSTATPTTTSIVTTLPQPPTGNPDWYLIGSIPDFPSAVTIHDTRMSLNATNTTLSVSSGGLPISSLLSGITRFFNAGQSFGGMVVPLIKLDISADFNVGIGGILKYRNLQLERVIDFARILYDVGFSADFIDDNTTTTTAPSVNDVQVSSLPIKLSAGVINTGLVITFPGNGGNTGSPVSVQGYNVSFTMALDDISIAYVVLPVLDVRVGDMNITFEVNVYPLVVGGNLSLQGLLDTTTLLSSAKLLRVFGVGVGGVGTGGTGVEWVKRMVERVDFEVPLRKIRGAAGGVVGGWLLAVLARSLGVV